MRREKNRQKYEKTKNGKPIVIRSSFKIDLPTKKKLLKKSGMSLQKTLEKLVKEYISD